MLPGLTARRAKERAWFIDGRLGARTTTLIEADDPLVEARVLDPADNIAARIFYGWRAAITGD